MIFNPTINFDFTPKFDKDATPIDTMDKLKMLGQLTRRI